jgi:hypothetical protein
MNAIVLRRPVMPVMPVMIVTLLCAMLLLSTPAFAQIGSPDRTCR